MHNWIIHVRNNLRPKRGKKGINKRKLAENRWTDVRKTHENDHRHEWCSMRNTLNARDGAADSLRQKDDPIADLDSRLNQTFESVQGYPSSPLLVNIFGWICGLECPFVQLIWCPWKMLQCLEIRRPICWNLADLSDSLIQQRNHHGHFWFLINYVQIELS